MRAVNEGYKDGIRVKAKRSTEKQLPSSKQKMMVISAKVPAYEMKVN